MPRSPWPKGGSWISAGALWFLLGFSCRGVLSVGRVGSYVERSGLSSIFGGLTGSITQRWNKKGAF